MKKTFSLVLALLFTAALMAGCGATASDAEANDRFYSDLADYDYASNSSVAESTSSGSGLGGTKVELDTESGSDSVNSTSSLQLGKPDPTRKLVYYVDYELETKAFDASVDSLLALTSSLGGYTESSETVGGNGTERRAEYVLRIPSESLQSFIESVGTIGSIQSENLTTDDVTLEYVDVESRLEALRAQETRLLELLSKAENLSDILQIEQSLSEVRYQIESYTTQLNTMSSLISYSTVTVRLYEVIEYTPAVTTPITFGERLSEEFSESIERVWDGVQDFIIWLLGNIVEIILVLTVIAAIVFAHIIVIRLIIRKCRRKNIEK